MSILNTLLCSGQSIMECFHGVAKVIQWFWAHSRAAESGCQGVTAQFLRCCVFFAVARVMLCGYSYDVTGF